MGNAAKVQIDDVVDTGFDGLHCMLVPREVTLGLELIDVAQSKLTNGVIRDHDLVFAGQTEWDGDVKDVDVLPTAAQDMLIGDELQRRPGIGITARAVSLLADTFRSL